MEKALLVDDEPATLKGLRTCVDWGALGLSICGEARNGKRALELVHEHHPAVVVADVRMPFVDGIELARTIHEEALDTKMVLISAYPDLDKAKSGFKLDAVDYVLKPIQVSELESAIMRALRKRERENRVKDLLRDKFLVELIAGVHVRNPAARERMHWLGLDLPLSCHYLVCVTRPVDEPHDPAARELLLMSAGDCLQSALSRQLGGQVFRSLAGELVSLIPVNLDRAEFIDALDGFLEQMQTDVEEAGIGRMWTGVGSEASDITQVNRAYESARIALEQRFFDPDQRVFYADFDGGQSADGPHVEPEDLELIRHALSSGNQQRLRYAVDGIVDAAVSAGNRDVRLIHSLGFRMMIEVADTLVSLGESGTDVAVQMYDAWRRVEAQHSVGEFKRRLLEYLIETCEALEEHRKTHGQVLVDQIQRLISENYGKPIGISQIAEWLQYTDSHICNVFKKHTGMTINAYLTRYRLERAGELLRDHSLRLYEICDRVGYRDYKHFITLFKREYGMTPSEYRDHLVYDE